MRAIQELLKNSELVPKEKQQYETIVTEIQQQLNDAQKDEAEFALMLRCAMEQKFRF